MGRRMRLLCLALVCLVALGWLGTHLWQAAPAAAGYRAKMLASAVFTSGLDPDRVLREDLAPPMFILRFVSTRVDREARTVTATAFGMATRTAVHRPGLGCTLLPEGSTALVPAGGIGASKCRRSRDTPWPRGSGDPVRPLPAGVDGARLEAALDSAFAEAGPVPRRTRAVVVVYDGHLVAERYAPGFTRDTALPGWSMTKAVLNAMVGILVGQGKLSVSDPAPIFEWRKPGHPKGAITVGHLLHMTPGLAFEENYGDPASDVVQMLFTRDDMAAYAAAKPLVAPPGTRFRYSSGTANVLARVVRNALGGAQADYLVFPRDHLFRPLGMESAVLEVDGAGTFVAGSAMYATARDWARFGLLYLQDGVWAGKRILPEGWVAFTATPTPLSSRGHYGALVQTNGGSTPERKDRWWPRLPKDVFAAVGHEGQNVIVVPSRRGVIVRLGLTRPSKAWDLEAFALSVLAALPPGACP